MKNTTLRQLAIFTVVARHLHYTRAARELGVTQASVSIQIRQLEAGLGLKLFEQVGKKIHLTEAGREMYDYCQRINHQFSELETVLERLKGGGGGELRISVGRTAKYFVPRLLAQFRQRHPEAVVHVDVATRDALLAQLEDNACDMAITGLPDNDRGLVAEPILQDSLAIIAAPGHPLARRRAIAPAELAGEPFLMREAGSASRATVERFLSRHALALDVVMTINSNEAIKRCVEAGLGLAVVPKCSIAHEVKAGLLSLLDVDAEPAYRAWYLVYRKGKRFSVLAESFRETVLETCRELGHADALAVASLGDPDPVTARPVGARKGA